MRFIRTLLSTLSLLEALTANAVFIEGSVQELRLARFPRLVRLCYREQGLLEKQWEWGGVCCFSINHVLSLCF